MKTFVRKTWTCLPLCVLFLAGFASSLMFYHGKVIAADIPFHSETVTAFSPTDPWEKAMGDINGDGKKDMIVGAPAGPLLWYAYPAWTPAAIGGPDSYDSGCGIAVGDIDNDGDLDVVMGGIKWFENPLPEGDPAAGTWTAHPVGNHRSHDIALADLDHDGKLDIVSRTQGSGGNVVYIYKQMSADAWELRSIPAVAGEGLALGDFDRDGNTDIAIAGQWYENTGSIGSGTWSAYAIAPSFNQVALIKSADINRDGRMDVVVSASEDVGEVAWYECPLDPKSEAWIEHRLGTSMDSVHGLGVADFDGDGDLDIAASEFRNAGRLIVFHNNDSLGTLWEEQVLGTQGLHNIVVDDYDDDGDFDIFGAYCWDNPPAYLWTNDSGPYILGLDAWTYINIDSSRSSPYFGLVMGDPSGGFSDIASGKYYYANPGNELNGSWQRTILPVESDANAVLDVDGDGLVDILSQALPNIYWFEALDTSATSFGATLVATGIPATGHGNSQGYDVGEIVGGGKEELVIASGGGIYCIQIPENPSAGNWPVVHITANAPEEGVAIGDIDNDGDNDVAAWIGTGSGSTQLGWWENPGDGSGSWTQYSVGSTISAEGDRVEIGDINNDGRSDIIVTETNDGETGSSVHWFECPENPREAASWTRHTVASDLGGMNSLDVRDMNNDGLLDIITGEHRGGKRVVVWENVAGGSGIWMGHAVDSGKESHLGARTGDLDNDGDFDIVSICWDDYPMLHLWRNDARIVSNPDDLNPPMLKSVRTTGSAYVVFVEFNEPVTSESAENIDNYLISDGIGVVSAVLDDDARTVILATDILTRDAHYTLTVRNIADVAENILVSAERLFVYDPQDLLSDLAGYWPLDEGSGITAMDTAANHYNGVLQNGAQWAMGHFGGGIDLDGEDDYVTLPNIDVSSDQMTLSAWFRADRLANCSSHDCRILSKASGTNGDDHYWMLSTIDQGGSTRLRFRLKTGGSTTTLIADSGSLSDNVWVHAVAVYDGTQMRLYKDAELVGATAKSGNLATNPEVAVNIGRNPDGYGPWDGKIDDVRIYQRALSEKEILGLYEGLRFKQGDVNHDSYVDLRDLVLCLQTISGSTVNQQLYPDAEVDGNNRLGLTEAIYILQETSQQQ